MERAEITKAACRRFRFRIKHTRELGTPLWATHIPEANGLIKFQSKFHFHLHFKGLLIYSYFHFKWKNVVHRLMPRRDPPDYTQWQEYPPWWVSSSRQEARPRPPLWSRADVLCNTHQGISSLLSTQPKSREMACRSRDRKSQRPGEGLTCISSCFSYLNCWPLHPFPYNHQTVFRSTLGKLNEANMCHRYQRSLSTMTVDPTVCLRHAQHRPTEATVFPIRWIQDQKYYWNFHGILDVLNILKG